jgi:glutamyl/glutaminyl-tRNA synthetase
MALINEAYAKERDGRFVVRWDDSHPVYIATLGADRMARIVEGQQNDLEWLGIKPDEYVRQSNILDDVHVLLENAHITVMPEEDTYILPELIGNDRVPLYPLTPTFTIEKVIMDYIEGVTHLIRGVDLLSEFGLYQYFCRQIALPRPIHIYLPRLRWQHGDMSKTAGAQSVCDLRNSGFTPGQVRDMVATACLRYPPNGWAIENLKGNPSL